MVTMVHFGGPRQNLVRDNHLNLSLHDNWESALLSMIKRFDRHRNLIICEVRVLSSHIMDKFGVLMVARIF
jgi:hypothetical protein